MMRSVTTNPVGETPDVGIPRRLAASMAIGEQQEWLRRHLDRHRVSRRTALKGDVSVLAALGATTAPWALAGCAAAAGRPVGVIGRHLSFGADPSRQMAVAAELTGKPDGRVVVEVGPDTSYGQTFEAEVRELVSMVPQQDGSIRAADQFFVHALADGLTPGATFHYRLRLADGTTTPDAVFTTAPPRAALEPFTFTAFADQGVNTDPTPTGQTGFSDNYYKPNDTRRTAAPSDALVALVAAQHPAFHLLAGDICYADPSGNGRPVKNNGAENPDRGFDNFDPTVWTQYFGVIEKSAATVPWHFATGNHDMEALYDHNTAPGGHAITYATTLDDVDATRIGVWGSSYSGGHVLVVGAIDRRVRAVVAQVPLISGSLNVGELVRADFRAGFREMFDADRAARFQGDPPAMVPVVAEDPLAPSALPTPDSWTWFTETGKTRAPSWRNEVTLRTVEMLGEYEPGSYIARISPTPLLLVVAREDHLTPAHFAIDAYERAREPKRLVILPGGHFDAYVDGFEGASTPPGTSSWSTWPDEG